MIKQLLVITGIVMLFFSCENKEDVEAIEKEINVEISIDELEDVFEEPDSLVEIIEIIEIFDSVVDLNNILNVSNLWDKTIPVYENYKIVERTTNVFREELGEEAHEEVYSVLLLEEQQTEIFFDTAVLLELNLDLSGFDGDSVKKISSCFKIDNYIVIECQTSEGDYQLTDRIYIFKEGEVVWKHVARHSDSCADDSATIIGVVSKKEGKNYLVIEHIMNDYTLVEMEGEFIGQYLYNDTYDPNSDYRM